VGAWQAFRSMDRINVPIRRGRTVVRGGYEFACSPVGVDGSFAVEGLKPGRWFLVHEEPGRAPTVVGPFELKMGESSRRVDIAAVEGGSIEGRVENVPPPMAGMIWVVAFDETIRKGQARVAADGSFRLEGLPPGRYGLKAGHDAYSDPHSLQDLGGREEILKQGRMPAEPWQGAVVVEVRPGETARGVVLDFRPPPPLPEPPGDDEAAKPAPK